MKRTTTETFDRFYFWEMLLRDFDEMDKYLVSAEQGHSVQKKMDAAFGISPNSRSNFSKESFWGPFRANLTSNKKKFLDTWRPLPAVYREFRNSLSTENLAYDGMLQRTVAEGPLDRLVSGLWFSPVQCTDLRRRKAYDGLPDQFTGKVRWDVDSYYLNDTAQEAGVFSGSIRCMCRAGEDIPEGYPRIFPPQECVDFGSFPVGRSGQIDGTNCW